MAAMTEPTGARASTGAAPPVESIPAALHDEASLVETFENTLEISQEVKPTDGAASEETEQEEPEQDGQAVRPPAETPTPGSKWAVGARCRAVWSEDGWEYPATVLALDGKRCRVRFDSYGNEEDVELSSLKAARAAAAQRQRPQDWAPGSRCRAVYSEDGLVYPAVVLWVKGQRCRIRFDDYNNEEEQDVGSLLSPDELRGPSRAAAKVRDRPSDQSRAEREAEERRRTQPRDEAEKLTNHIPSLFPPFPPPQLGSGDPLPFISAPPPLWTLGGSGREGGGSPGVDTTSNMLMLWYMCGFHTGSFMVSVPQQAQQLLRSTSRD